ncbi:MAG TPA: VTT domain-containing protein [Micromonosporaceae bacterium]
MEGVVAWLGGLPPALVYVVAAVLVFGETGLLIGLVLPGEATLIVVGFLGSLSTVNPYLAAALMIAAAFVGDTLGFYEGRRYGPRLHASRLGQWVGQERWTRAEALLERQGGRAVFLGRFVAFGRTLMPRLCAVGGMPYRRFLGWDALGVSAQVSASVLVGFIAGGSYRLAAEFLGRATGAFLLLLLVLVGLVVFGRYLGRHPDPVTAFGQRLARWSPLRRLEEAYDEGFRWLTRRAGVGGAVAVSVLLGVLLLLGAGVVLTVVIDAVVRQSGVPLVDPLIAQWFAAQRSPGTVQAASVLLSVLRGFFLVVAAGVVGLVLNRRPGRWRPDLLGVLGTVGAFLPLVILAAATELSRSGQDVAPGLPLLVHTGQTVGGEAVVAAGEMFGGRGLYGNQVTLVTASVGLVAWLLTRRWRRWGVRVTAWTAAVGVVLLVGVSRLYLGWNWPSEVLASMLLGAAWVIVFAVAWRTRDRLRATDPEAERTLAGTPVGR